MQEKLRRYNERVEMLSLRVDLGHFPEQIDEVEDETVEPEAPVVENITEARAEVTVTYFVSPKPTVEEREGGGSGGGGEAGDECGGYGSDKAEPDEERDDNDDDNVMIGAVFRGTSFVQIQANGTMKVVPSHVRQPSMYDIEFCPESDSDEEVEGCVDVGLDLMGGDSKEG